MNKKFYVILFSIIILSLHLSMIANMESKKETDSNNRGNLKEETAVITHHTVKINGVEIPYKAIAGTLHLKNADGLTKGTFFYIAYHQEGIKNPSERPVTFCFNGGPGSSSIWLHLGVFGPRKIVLDEDGRASPPFQFIDNPLSILDKTDLVFIDPISTGYSRVAAGEDPKQFHGVEEDIQSIGEFIRLYTTRENLWGAPKFLAGESYGTTRAAGLANYLHREHHYYFNGIILISSILNFQTVFEGDGNDLPYILLLPSYSATAWHHKKLPPELLKDFQQTQEEVKDFAIKEYALALMQGDSLPRNERDQIIQKLSRYTGLSPQYIEQSNLRIPVRRFAKELLRQEAHTVGRFDSRFKGIDGDLVGDCFEYDPSVDAIFGGFTAAFNQYVRSELNWKEDQEYVIMAKVSPWNYGKACHQSLNVTDHLREVLTRNPSLRVFVANGYYDLATPYFATEYTFNHLGIDPSLRNRITMTYYDAGHMMYIHYPSFVKLKKNLSNWLLKKS